MKKKYLNQIDIYDKIKHVTEANRKTTFKKIKKVVDRCLTK